MHQKSQLLIGNPWLFGRKNALLDRNTGPLFAIVCGEIHQFFNKICLATASRSSSPRGFCGPEHIRWPSHPGNRRCTNHLHRSLVRIGYHPWCQVNPGLISLGWSIGSQIIFGVARNNENPLQFVPPQFSSTVIICDIKWGSQCPYLSVVIPGTWPWLQPASWVGVLLHQSLVWLRENLEETIVFPVKYSGVH